jgi:hypothetical protein
VKESFRDEACKEAAADERPERARQIRQRRKLKTRFPLDLVAGFAR